MQRVPSPVSQRVEHAAILPRFDALCTPPSRDRLTTCVQSATLRPKDMKLEPLALYLFALTCFCVAAWLEHGWVVTLVVAGIGTLIPALLAKKELE